MYTLNEQQIDFILDDIRARGVEMESLQQNLLDHICCIIENNLEANGDFGEFYQQTIRSFYKDALWELEEETLQLLIFKNYYTMKKIMIISGTVSAAAMSSGIFFKFMHWPGASLLIILGIAISSLVFLPLLFTLKAKEKQRFKDKLSLGIAATAGALISLAILFRIMHWPGANILGLLFICLMGLIYIPVFFFSGIRHPDTKVNTIAGTLLMIMGCGLFLTLVNTRPYIQEDSNAVSNQALQESYLRISEQTRLLSRTAFVGPAPDHERYSQAYNTACERIEALKLRLINACEDTQVKTINYDALGKLDNYNQPTLELFEHADSAPIPGVELKALRQDLENINSLARQVLPSGGSYLELGSQKNRRTGLPESWEMHQFYHTPLINVLRNLTQLQINIRFLQVLHQRQLSTAHG